MLLLPLELFLSKLTALLTLQVEQCLRLDGLFLVPRFGCG